MIYLGADHGGFELKEKIKSFLLRGGYLFEDIGNITYDKEDDYPVYAFAVAERVGKEDSTSLEWKKRVKGILFCRSAAGMIIAANKVKNVRAVAAMDKKSAIHAREHNDANIIAISGDWTTDKEAENIISAWLETEFSREDRHVKRIGMIRDYENAKD